MSFDPMDGIRSADAMILFRAATKQVCRRLGFHASFMCKPKLPGAYSSGWHLHQSLASAESGTNLFAAEAPPGPLSDVGKHLRRRTPQARKRSVGIHNPVDQRISPRQTALPGADRRDLGGRQPGSHDQSTRKSRRSR